jgi:hypothetical protein
MPDMPGHIARPRFLRLHDEYLNGSRENRRRFGLGLLSGDPLAGVYRHLRIGTAADWRHLEREFYAEEGHLAYWPYNRYGFLGNKQEILRQGALETIRVVEGLPASLLQAALAGRAGYAAAGKLVGLHGPSQLRDRRAERRRADHDDHHDTGHAVPAGQS